MEAVGIKGVLFAKHFRVRFWFSAWKPNTVLKIKLHTTSSVCFPRVYGSLMKINKWLFLTMRP